jgi:hypothetical protein
MSKVAEQAKEDLARILVEARPRKFHNGHERNLWINREMQDAGWETTMITLLDTARDLGFPVVGERIYEEDD